MYFIRYRLFFACQHIEGLRLAQLAQIKPARMITIDFYKLHNLSFFNLKPFFAKNWEVIKSNLQYLTKQMQKVLIVVDIQNDFCEGGSLATDDSSHIIPLINALKNQPIFSHVILTQDWHPSNHVSFASTHNLSPFTIIEVDGKKQELWPDHCVAGTHGAEFSPLLQVKETDVIVKKGIFAHADSYSGFFDDGKQVFLKRKLEEFGTKQVVLCGLALDFCVGSTAIDAKKLGFDVTIVKQATRSVSPTTEQEMCERLKLAGVKVASINDLVS